ncbi:hypothetical protein DENIS_0655 [Desulfonema ishimotonii]|uniref:Class III cytochrome C domain-containing protein n=1 Tax=Desulfonema ishimotonii TaxID=45657 RepID=A0A401FRX0_9BACT|nr:cytochrome c3 family protein [Desulfonema ishimotonii]GBC59714.1 hypothetical protein DENIS_0655 [Desulfonema ishimotonii]
MDRMLLSALILWFVTLSFVRIGPAVPPPDAGLDGRYAAFFPHDKHMEVVDDCKACHHRYDENGGNVVEEDELDGGDAMRCRTCHTEDASVNAREAFHRMCIQCHRTVEKSENPSGPRTCGGCHPVEMPEDPTPLVIER